LVLINNFDLYNVHLAYTPVRLGLWSGPHVQAKLEKIEYCAKVNLFQ